MDEDVPSFKFPPYNRDLWIIDRFIGTGLDIDVSVPIFLEPVPFDATRNCKCISNEEALCLPVLRGVTTHSGSSGPAARSGVERSEHASSLSSGSGRSCGMADTSILQSVFDLVRRGRLMMAMGLPWDASFLVANSSSRRPETRRRREKA